MNSKHEIIATDNFAREVKALAKKHRSIKQDLVELEQALLNNPFFGTNLGNDAYKIRLAIKSKGKGKSGGARVISYLVEKVADNSDAMLILLLSIYDKAEVSSISDARIKFLIESHSDRIFELQRLHTICR